MPRSRRRWPAGLRRAIQVLAALFLLAPLPAYAVSDDVILADTPPRQLSAFGFFDDLAAQKPAEGVIPFRLNTPLFSDGALKDRFVYLPAGKAAAHDATEAFDFPVGSALIKTFSFPADYREPDKDIRRIETRVLLRHADGWQAWAYLWNSEQTDAALKIAGATVPVSTVTAGGTPLDFAYSVPNKNQCKACYALDNAIVPLGPKARNLNGPFPYASGEENQLAHWAAAGILAGAPPPAEAPAVPDWRDETASNSGLFLTFGEKDPVRYGVRKRPVAAGKGAGANEFDILPGEPDDSILVYRVRSVEPGVMMPELGRHLADPDAVALLRAWIAAMDD